MKNLLLFLVVAITLYYIYIAYVELQEKRIAAKQISEREYLKSIEKTETQKILEGVGGVVGILNPLSSLFSKTA